ncbi:MAG: cyclodeaminase/cyclohydrolase family protein [Atopobiaceae bacterium]|nr:cyclodeaminase/cyclohydrolase family protein [Atopobiaceae bacterium]
MQDKLMQGSCTDFCDALAAREPTPGGGGAASYVGALAAALCSMVGNYTTGKKAYVAVQDEIGKMLEEAEASRIRLMELVDEDAEAFLPLSRAYAIPKDDPERASTLEEATKCACAAPLQMMREICGVVELLEEMGKKGSRMLQSDVACGALLARAALEAASINVFVNTRTLTDRSFASATEGEVDEMLVAYVPRAQACADGIVAALRNR